MEICSCSTTSIRISFHIDHIDVPVMSTTTVIPSNARHLSRFSSPFSDRKKHNVPLRMVVGEMVARVLP